MIFFLKLLKLRNIHDVKRHENILLRALRSVASQRDGAMRSAIMRVFVGKDVIAALPPDGLQDHVRPEILHRRALLDVAAHIAIEGVVSPLKSSLRVDDQNRLG